MDDLSDQVANKARRAVEHLRDYSDEELDFSEASLCAVEKMLVDASEYAQEMHEKQITVLVRLLGSYVLEVGRKEFGGKYYWHGEREQPLLIVGEPKFKVGILTFDKVRGRLLRDLVQSIPSFYRGFAQQARDAEPGTDSIFG